MIPHNRAVTYFSLFLLQMTSFEMAREVKKSSRLARQCHKHLFFVLEQQKLLIFGLRIAQCLIICTVFTIFALGKVDRSMFR